MTTVLMKKNAFPLFIVLILSCLVVFGSFYLSQLFGNRTFSAGSLMNYPFKSSSTPAEIFRSNTPLPLVDRTQLFNNTPLSISDCVDCVTLLVTGDVLPARSVNQKTVSMNNFIWPWEKTLDFLKTADITIINLETPLVSDCAVKTDGMVFCGDQRNLAGLKAAGVDVVNFANNHAGNAGKQGVTQTNALLQQSGMLVTGIEQPVYQTYKGTKFAFLGYNDVEKYGFIADVDEARMQSEINQARQNADVVIVQFHWGEEYRYQPTTRQVELGHLAVEYGADLVIGNHPHWIQGVEWYKDKLITYSHGNFIFDQMWSTETRQGIVGKYVFQEKNLVDVSFYPVFIENYGQPRWMDGAEKQRMLDIMKRESERIGEK